MASSSTSSVHKSYDVFLSFSGEARRTFVDHLFVALDQQGIHTFKDDKRLEKGKRINDEILQSIEDSRLYIIVFSKNYASSSWCLNELLKIMECHKKKEQIAYPVFYDVEPTEVRKQSGSVGEALSIHKNESEVGIWREALKEAANLSGWDLRKIADGHEAQVIRLIVEEVSRELCSFNVNIDEKLVGIEQRMQDLELFLKIGLDDVHMIGIKGMGGAGKTTLARAIFDKLSTQFEARTFVENVREVSKASLSGLKSLQKQVLADVLKDKYITISSVQDGKNMMKMRLSGKKVLVVLDDVDHISQLEALAGDNSWFKPGSRIIITTRDEQVLLSHRVSLTHYVDLLSDEEAMRLFSRYAFGKEIPVREYGQESLEVVRYAAGLPLTIKVLGSLLCGKDKPEWIDTLARLKTIPLEETVKKLEVSYESLEDEHKKIFLDVACLLKNWKREDAIRMLDGCGFHARNGLRVLQRKSLITIEEVQENGYHYYLRDESQRYEQICMHDHIEEMGKNIVRRLHPDDPCRHSRLWVQDEIKDVLACDIGTEETRCIRMELTPDIDLTGLLNMKKLRCLIVNYDTLHTTRSWDFLKYQTLAEPEFRARAAYNISSSNKASDVVIGVLDTGVWPESESFNDDGFGPIPSKWKGTCMESDDLKTTSCNRKLIGARYYKSGGDSNSPRDGNGHGTHVASTAAGNEVSNASYYGLAMGSAKGGFPGSRIASYRVCGFRGCLGSNILAAFDDAIEDGVDVLSLSLGSRPGYGPNFQRDPIAIGSFHAVEKGVTVVCSAGNDGPSRESVVNVAPWVITVAASSIDRDFQADIALGDKTVIKGGGINFGELQRSPVYPLLYGNSAKRDSSNYDEIDAKNCIPRALDQEKVKGNIVLCENEEGLYSVKQKLAGVKNLGAIGMVIISDEARAVASSAGSFAMAAVSRIDGKKLISYASSTRKPTATILPTVSVTQYKPAPVVAYFSARGPSFATPDILKPDVAAPGVAILASWPDKDSVVKLAGKNPPLFYILSGTSMACPHVSGLAAMIKSQNPDWSPAAVRSALMTTASQTNNIKKPITTNSGSIATPYDFGAGEVTSDPLQPGLVYETEIIHYLHYLCNIGYNVDTIKRISSTVPSDFTCPSNSNKNLVSNMNYPSIAISKFNGKERKVSRTVTNVDNEDTTYTASVEAPNGLKVKVVPNKLEFTESKNEITYQVIFTSDSKLSGDKFGAITWSNGKYRVRSPFVVSSK